MKKVLIISLAFPPITNVGVYRITKFCKFLPRYGWKPLVLTQYARKFREGTDWTPLDELDNDLTIIRTPNFQPFYWWDNRKSDRNTINRSSVKNTNHLCVSPPKSIKEMIKPGIQFLRNILTVPDERMAWIPQALIPAIKHIRKENIDIIFSSSPSPTNHILGFILSKITGVPHVVDFRDLWTLNEVYEVRGLPDYLVKYDQLWEKLILRHSKMIIVVNRTLRTQLSNAYPKICENKIDFIYNGFDKDDFNKIKFANKPNDKFTIVYAGSIYGHRNPDFFLKALKIWLNNKSSSEKRVKVDFYGNTDNDYNKIVDEIGIGNVVKFHPRIQKDAITQILFNADLSLLIHGFSKKTISSTSTKLFEYMATNKPILAIMPASEAADIIENHTKSCIVSSPDIEKIVQFLDEQYNLWMKGAQSQQIISIPKVFSREGQAEKLGNCFNNVINDIYY